MIPFLFVGRGIIKVLDFIIPYRGHNELANFELDSDDEKIADGIYTSDNIRKRMFKLMDDSHADMKESMNLSLAIGIFLTLTFVGIFLNLWLLQILALLLALRYLIMDGSLTQRINNELGFIDGMMYVCAEVTRDLNSVREDPKAMKRVLEEMSEDLKKMK